MQSEHLPLLLEPQVPVQVEEHPVEQLVEQLSHVEDVEELLQPAPQVLHVEDVELLLQAVLQPAPQVLHVEDVELLLQAVLQLAPQVLHVEDVELLLQAELQLPPQPLLPVNAPSKASSSLSHAENSVGPKVIPANIGNDLLKTFLKKFLLLINSLFILFTVKMFLLYMRM